MAEQRGQWNDGEHREHEEQRVQIPFYVRTYDVIDVKQRNWDWSGSLGECLFDQFENGDSASPAF